MTYMMTCERGGHSVPTGDAIKIDGKWWCYDCVRAEIERLHEFCKELWWARRNLAFGPAGEKQVLAEFPWITEPIRAAEAAGGEE